VDERDLEKYNMGEGLVKNIFLYLSADEREVLVSQTCGTCRDEMFKEPEGVEPFDEITGPMEG
jgi:hypothetical protein